MDGTSAPPLRTVNPDAVRRLFRPKILPHMRYIADVTCVPKGKLPIGLNPQDRMWFYLSLELTEPEKIAFRFKLREIDDNEKPNDRYISDVCWRSSLCVRVTLRKENLTVAKRDLPKMAGELLCKIVDERDITPCKRIRS